MDSDRNKGAQINIEIFKELANKKKPKIKPIALYSSNSNVNINHRKINFIHLSRLFKNKLDILNQNNSNLNMDKTIKFNSVGKISLKHNKNMTHYINSLNNYNSLSYKKMPFLKLPKIKKKNENEKKEFKDSLVSSILNKFDQFDNKFKQQGKISEFIIQRGDKYLKLKKDYTNDENEKYKYCASKQNYKKQYSKLFKRIKDIHHI